MELRVKRSSALVVVMEGEDFVFHSCLSQKAFLANPTALEIVRRLYDWTDLEALFGFFPDFSRESVVRSVRELIDLGAVVVEDSDEAYRDDEYETRWLWGPLAAAYHFGTRDGSFLLDDDADQMLGQLAKIVPSPPLFLRNTDPATVINLPLRDSYPEPFKTMARRRTNRMLLDRPISLEQLSDCFLFSMAITAMMVDDQIGDLPLKMTPSGGARNPFEGYVCVRQVEGLAPGAYHYSAFDRTLGLVRADAPPAFPTLMAGQRWTQNAAAIIFLVANFERPMWKYHDSAAYRVTAIEAGHIAQNMMLVATGHGFVANATGAMSLDLVEETLGVGGITQSVIYSLVLGVPDASVSDAAG